MDLSRALETIGHYIVFVFSLSMAAVLALRFVRVHRRLQNYSSVLQLSLSQAQGQGQAPGQHMQVALGEVLRLLGGERALLFEGTVERKELALLSGRTATGQLLDGDLDSDSTLVTQVQRRKQPAYLLLVAISDIDITANGVLFLVMELVRGTTLKLIRERYRDAVFATFVTHQIAQGLHAIHSQGIVHRDRFQKRMVRLQNGASHRQRRRLDHADSHCPRHGL